MVAYLFVLIKLIFILSLNVLVFSVIPIPAPVVGFKGLGLMLRSLIHLN